MPIDYKKYCADWKLRSKFIRFYRANNHCEWCGVENYSEWGVVDGNRYHIEDIDDINVPFKKIKIVLTVSHIDHNINNNSFFNLAALCQRCHLRHDAKLHAINRNNKRYKNMESLFK